MKNPDAVRTLDVILATANFAWTQREGGGKGKEMVKSSRARARRVPELFTSDWSRVIADAEEEKF